MNNTLKIALIAGSIVAAAAGGTALGVVYVRFEKAQKVIESRPMTVGEMLASRDAAKSQASDETTCPDAAEIFPVEETTESPAETVFDAKVVAAAKKLEKAGKVVSAVVDPSKDVEGEDGNA